MREFDSHPRLQFSQSNSLLSLVLVLPLLVLEGGCTGIPGVGEGTTPSPTTPPSSVTISVGSEPTALAINTITNQIYVADANSASVTVVDGGTNAVVTTIPVGTNPGSLAVNESTNQIIVGNNTSNTYTLINGTINTLTGTFGLLGPCCPQYNGIVLNPTTNEFYAIDQKNGVTAILPLDTTTYVKTGSAPGGVAVNPTTNQIYVANSSSQTLTIINGSTNQPTATVTFTSCSPAGAYLNAFRANGVAVNPTTNTIYVPCGNYVAVVNGTTYTYSLVTSPGGPLPIAVNPTTNQIYAVNEATGTVTVIDGATNGTTTVPTGNMPEAIAINTTTNQIYVANTNSATVTDIDGATNATTTIQVGNNPKSVAVNPITNILYVVNSADGTLTVIPQ